MTETQGNRLWSDVRITGLYTLSPLHCGIGQVAGAVDLPVAREAGTDFPIIPATGLKGAARMHLRGLLDDETMDVLFGPELQSDKQAGASATEENTRAGLLSFMEARLLAYPMRALVRPFLYVTCPMILGRLQRDLRALRPGGAWAAWAEEPMPKLLQEKAGVTREQWRDEPLVIEDLAYTGQDVAQVPWLEQTAARMAELLPPGEDFTRQQLRENLVCIPDADFGELIQRVIPVRARTQLTDGKTTDKWIGPHGQEQKGNLWYEEYIPADTLFVQFVGQRRPGDGATPSAEATKEARLTALDRHAEALRYIQVGGNETVGYGLCWWSGWGGGQARTISPQGVGHGAASEASLTTQPAAGEEG